MDSPVFVRPAGNGPKGETGTKVKNQKTGGFLRPEGALIPPPQDADQHRMGVEVHHGGAVSFLVNVIWFLINGWWMALAPFGASVVKVV